MTQEEIDAQVREWADRIRMKDRIKAIDDAEKARYCFRVREDKEAEGKAIKAAIVRSQKLKRWWALKQAFKEWWEGL